MPTKNPYFGALSILTSLFFIWGFITCLNDILIPHLKAVFTLNYTQVMLVQFCFFAAYFIVSIPCGYFVEKFSYQTGIITGLAIAGTGCLLFYPAAGLHSYLLFLVAFFILAAGITLLQVSANPYVTILGDPATASSRLTLTQAFNSLGTTVAPYVGSAFILAAAVKSTAELSQLGASELADYQATQAAAVQVPYLYLAGCLFALALLFARLQLPAITPARNVGATPVQQTRQSAWQYPQLVLGAIGIFVYVGAEVAIGSFLISYLGEPNIAALPAAEAGKYVTWYWGGAMVGRFLGASLMHYFAAGKLLAFNALMAMLLVLTSLCSSGSLAMWSIISIGLFNSIMFPTLFSLALQGLGTHTGQGSGILCAAIVGGAILPLVQGVLADHLGIQTAFFLPALCYAYIVYYGWHGSRAQ